MVEVNVSIDASYFNTILIGSKVITRLSAEVKE